MNNLMRKETPDEWGLKELQNVILNIAYDIDQFCQKHTAIITKHIIPSRGIYIICIVRIIICS